MGFVILFIFTCNNNFSPLISEAGIFIRLKTFSVSLKKIEVGNEMSQSVVHQLNELHSLCCNCCEYNPFFFFFSFSVSPIRKVCVQVHVLFLLLWLSIVLEYEVNVFYMYRYIYFYYLVSLDICSISWRDLCIHLF